MPIVDIQLVAPDGIAPAGTAAMLAEALGLVFHADVGRVWVRLSVLPTAWYAENGVADGEAPNPVFVCVTHADLPPVESLVTQARAISTAVAGCLGRAPELVHVEFAPPGRGRMAFGGNLLVQVAPAGSSLK